MRITIVHNPEAGDERVTPGQLCDALRAAGHEPVHASTKADDWAAAVQEADDLVLAAGGDGTVGKVGAELLRREETRRAPLAVLPFGTANNIAESIGVRGDWRRIVQQLDSWSHMPFDVGIATGTWGKRAFLEGVGFGLFPHAMARARDESTEVARQLGRAMELVCDVARVHRVLAGIAPQPCAITLDDDAIGADVLLLAVMNIAYVGPRLDLAPAARPDDGLLHVMIARESHRPVLERYLEARLEGESPSLELEEHVAREISVESCPGPIHIDDRLVEAHAGRITARLLPGALRMLAPRPARTPTRR